MVWCVCEREGESCLYISTHTDHLSFALLTSTLIVLFLLSFALLIKHATQELRSKGGGNCVCVCVRIIAEDRSLNRKVEAS